MRRLRLAGEDGMALVMAMGIMFVLMISFTTVIYLTTSNSRHAARGKAEQTAYAIAEAGLNNAAAQLQQKYPSGESNLSGSPSVTLGGTKAYAGGSATWSGTFTPDGSGYGGTWTLTSTGTVGNPTGPGSANVRRTITGLVNITHWAGWTGAPPAWNYVYSGGTSCTTIDNTVTFTAPLYTPGDLCLSNQGKMLQPASYLAVGGRVTISNPQGSIGTSTQKIQDVYIAGGCKYANNPIQLTCIPNTALSNIWATNYTPALPVPPISPPIPNWQQMYDQASPGPWHPCETVSGTPPTFDRNAAGQPVPLGGTPDGKNNNAGTFNITPSSSYTCRTSATTGPGASDPGELSWNASTKTLTVKGIIYIDGSLTVNTSGLSRYTGAGVIYLTGTLNFQNNSILCGKVSGSNCDFNTWAPGSPDPFLIFEADGLGAGNNSIQIDQSTVQAGFYGTNGIELRNSSTVEGPMITLTVLSIRNSSAQKFPAILSVPGGTSGTSYVHRYSLAQLRNVTY